MFGWRRRKDGFEWREYVRTTILLRRKKRQERIDAARQAAVDGLKEAGARGAAASAKGAEAAVEGSKRAGSWLGRALQSGYRNLAAGMRSGGKAVASGAQRMGGIAAQGGARAGRAAFSGLGSAVKRGGAGLSPAMDLAAQPRFLLPLSIVGLAAAAGALTKTFSTGFDTAASIAAAIAIIVLLLCLGPYIALVASKMSSGLSGILPEKWSRPSALSSGILGKVAAGLAGLLLLGGLAYGGYSLTSSLVGAMPERISDFMPKMPSLSSYRETVTGPARVINGDTLKIEDKIIMLAGIEAPERRQFCERPGARRWRCGATATSALKKTVRGRKLTCTIDATDAAGRMTGTCRDGETDIAETMVSGGYVFASNGVFSSYASAEAAAREAKSGIWRGTPQRPEEFRAEKWQKASKRAPEGCPIKGRALGSKRKVYLLPWSRSYDKFRIRKTRGDRWFCSEEEALEAGWRPYEQS